jgi:hypothetical protein
MQASKKTATKLHATKKVYRVVDRFVHEVGVGLDDGRIKNLFVHSGSAEVDFINFFAL